MCLKKLGPYLCPSSATSILCSKDQSPSRRPTAPQPPCFRVLSSLSFGAHTRGRGRACIFCVSATRRQALTIFSQEFDPRFLICLQAKMQLVHTSFRLISSFRLMTRWNCRLVLVGKLYNSAQCLHARCWSTSCKNRCRI